MVPRTAIRSANEQRRGPGSGDHLDVFIDLLGNEAAILEHVFLDGVGSAFANARAVEIDAGHARLRGEGNERGFIVQMAPAQAVFFLGQDDDGAAFGSFVGEGSELRGVGQLGIGHTGSGNEFCCLAIAERDGSGFVEQQGIDIARGFHGAAGHGHDVALNDAVNARDADGGEQTADRRGNQANQQRPQHECALRRARIHGHWLQGGYGQQENNGEARQQNVQRDFVGRFLPRCAFHHFDHAVEKGFARVGCDAYLDFVGEHARAARDRRAVAAGFANDGRGFTGDRRFVHRGDAVDDFAVSGNEFARR